MNKEDKKHLSLLKKAGAISGIIDFYEKREPLDDFERQEAWEALKKANKVLLKGLKKAGRL